MRSIVSVMGLSVLVPLMQSASGQDFWYAPPGSHPGYTYGIPLGQGFGYGYGLGVSLAEASQAKQGPGPISQGLTEGVSDSESSQTSDLRPNRAAVNKQKSDAYRARQQALQADRLMRLQVVRERNQRHLEARKRQSDLAKH